jgi:uncharacterized protein (DUF433 family)
LNEDDSGTILEGKEADAVVNYDRFIVRDPAICGGAPVIKGTRVTLRTILASLAEGASVQEILADFPSLDEEDVRAVIAFAAVSAEEDIPIQPIPVVA